MPAPFCFWFGGWCGPQRASRLCRHWIKESLFPSILATGFHWGKTHLAAADRMTVKHFRCVAGDFLDYLNRELFNGPEKHFLSFNHHTDLSSLTCMWLKSLTLSQQHLRGRLPSKAVRLHPICQMCRHTKRERMGHRMQHIAVLADLCNTYILHVDDAMTTKCRYVAQPHRRRALGSAGVRAGRRLQIIGSADLRPNSGDTVSEVLAAVSCVQDLMPLWGREGGSMSDLHGDGKN